MKKIMNAVVFFLLTYPAGLCVGIVFDILESFGILEVKGWRNFPLWRNRLLVVSNHPSLVEPILLIGMFAHQYVFRPLKYGPLIVVDSKTYFKGWKRVFYWFLWPVLIELDREDTKTGAKSLLKAKRALEGGGDRSVVS